METEKFEKKMFDECKDKLGIKSTISENMQDKLCPVCNTPCIHMRLEKSPKEGYKPSEDDIFRFYGCEQCLNICYKKHDLELFGVKKSSLKDHFVKSFNQH